MDDSRSDDSSARISNPSDASTRRRFLGNVAKATGGLRLADPPASTAPASTGSTALAQTGGTAPAVQLKKFNDWGWPQPYEQISAKSKQWLQNKGWWPLNAAWIVVWSGQEMIGHVMQTLKLLERRGIETEWRTFV